MKKILFVLTMSGAIWACSSKKVTTVSTVGSAEPTYKLDRRLKAAQTASTGLTGAVGTGTGGSYGGHNYRSQAYKQAAQKKKVKTTVSPVLE